MAKLGVLVTAAMLSACSNGGGSGTSGGPAGARGNGGSSAGGRAGASGSGGAAGNSGGGGGSVQGTPLTGVTAVSGGNKHACALLKGGSIVCWGENAEGELGNGSTANSTMAVPVSGIVNATAISAGYDSSCAVLADATVSCWGNNDLLQLGNTNGMTTPSNAVAGVATTPVTVAGVSDATMVAVGYGIACVVVSGGTVRCWGAEAPYVVDDGGSSRSATPMTVPGLDGVTAISLTENTCVLVTGGQVQCWLTGDTHPSVVPSVTATAISGDCALTPNGSIRCWGNVTNIVGDAGPTGLGGFTSLSNNGSSACAVEGPAGIAVVCWGSNMTGELGAGLITQTGPFDVIGVTGVASVAMGGFGFACAVMNDGSVQCWGNNQLGQLGNGRTEDIGNPGAVLVPL